MVAISCQCTPKRLTGPHPNSLERRARSPDVDVELEPVRLAQAKGPARIASESVDKLRPWDRAAARIM